MKVSLNVGTVFAVVTGAALAGMILGGLFGWVAGTVAPGLFANLIMWTELEPVGTALVLGSFGGVLCGGALGGFAVVVQLIAQWVTGRSAKA